MPRVMVNFAEARRKLMRQAFMSSDSCTMTTNISGASTRRVYIDYTFWYEAKCIIRLEKVRPTDDNNDAQLGTLLYIDGANERFLSTSEMDEILAQYQEKYKHKNKRVVRNDDDDDERRPRVADVRETLNDWYLQDGSEYAQPAHM